MWLVNYRLKKYHGKGKKSQIRRRILTTLACVVVFCTVYALILPAITMSGKSYCGQKEHEHSEKCYSKEVISTEEKLVCGQEEEEPHQHTDACYSEVQAEAQGEEEESSAEETSTEQESAPQRELTCEKKETKGHVHTKDCYETVETYGESELICGKEEHKHSLQCYSNPEADVETEADWEKTLADVTLTRDWKEDTIAIAKSQLGYEESTANYEVVDGDKKKGYTRYGEFYGVKYGDWCAMFVSFCLNYAEVEDFPVDASCEQWIAKLKEVKENSKDSEGVVQYDAYKDAAEEYVPERGNLVFFNWDSEADADHVGIIVDVTEKDGETWIRTIEGNVSDTVKYKEYRVNDDTIMGYGILPEQEFYCGESAHMHDSDCYEDGALICGKEEHAHVDACEVKAKKADRKGKLSAEDQERVERVIALIDELPTSEEIGEELSQYEEDSDEYNAYLEEIVLDARTVYAYYEDLGEELQKHVTNADKLLELAWLYEAEPLADNVKVMIRQVNTYDKAVTTLVHGGSVQDKLGSGMGFNYWDAIVVEKNESGQLYVSQYITKVESKLNYKAETPDGFVILLYQQSVDTKAGDGVTVTFDISGVTGYNASGYGKVVFKSTSKLDVVKGADTRDKIEVNLYDYGANINEKYESNKKYPGFQQEYGQNTKINGTYDSNFGNNITADLAAGIDGVTKDGTGINQVVNGANSPTSGAMYPTLKDGYPALSDGTSLDYLFSNNKYATKKNSKNINGLFQYDETTGAYSYNSRVNHAQFNASDDTFTLYEQIISSNFIWYPFGNFLPFNDIVHQATQASSCDRSYFKTIEDIARDKGNNGSGDEYSKLATALNTWISKMDSETKSTSWKAEDALKGYFTGSGGRPSFTAPDEKTTEQFLENVYSIDYDEATDFFFGMEMKMRFMQPNDGLTGNDGKQPMVFYFTGDDDVWVYIDNKLFLDLSGIHRHVGGEIDFVNGVVKYYSLDINTGDVSIKPYKEVTFAEILGSSDGLNEKGTFKDYSTHTFNFYYMERGAGSGVCRMNFNFPLLHKNSISVTKELSADANVDLLGNPDFKFQVLKGDKGEEPFIGAGVSYDIYDKTGTKVGTGTTGANGVFTIKAGQTAVFPKIDENAGTYRVRELLDESIFQQYGKVSVDGSDKTSDAYTKVVIESETFKGIESPVKDVSDGNTSFKFNNKVATEKVGALQLTKTVVGETTDSAKTYQFEVKLDGEPLKVGTPYTVTKGATSIEKTVEKDGIIEVPAGETATIKNILAGSKFEVQETAESAAGYIVTYAGGTMSTVDKRNAVTGTIGVEKVVELTATNTVNGAEVTIPGEKHVQDPDGKEHTYTMKLVEVTDATGETKVSPEYLQTTEVTLSETSKEFVFTLPYTEKGVGTVPRHYFYKISEVIDSSDLTTKYDDSTYVVETEVSKDTTGKLTAKVVHVWKDGKEVTDQKVTFTNQQLYTLTLKKVLEVPDESERKDEFSFSITLSQEGSPVTGEFTISKGGKTEKITFDEDGKADVTLAAGESLTIYGLPKNVSWEICETNADGYHATYQVGTSETVTEGPSISGTLTEQDIIVTCINKTSYQLPESGGIGTSVFMLGGCAALGLALLILRKRKWC